MKPMSGASRGTRCNNKASFGLQTKQLCNLENGDGHVNLSILSVANAITAGVVFIEGNLHVQFRV